MESNASESSQGGRVAVIVVAGVGDDARGSGRDAVAAALRSDPGGRWSVREADGEETLVARADTGEQDGPELRTGTGSPNLREPFPVPTARLAGAAGAPDVDVYEMHWADLSRARGRLPRLFYLLVAITMQVSTIGLEAVRRSGIDTVATRQIRRVLNLMSFWLVYVITPLVLAMLVLAVIVNLELLSGADGATAWAAVAVAGLAGAAAGSWVADRTYRGGWTFDDPSKDPVAFGPAPSGDPWPTAVLVGVTVVALLVVLCAASGFATQLMVQVAYLTAVGGAAVLLATRFVRRSHQVPGDQTAARHAARRGVRLVIRTAYAAVPAGAVVLAVLGEPREGRAAVRAANALTMVAAGPFRLAWIVLLVLSAACVGLLVWLRRGGVDIRKRLSATVMLAVMLGPVLYALVTTALFLIFAALWRLYPDSAKAWKGAATLRCPGETIDSPAVACATPPATTSDWGTDIVRAAIQPLGLALVLAAVVIGVIGWFFTPYLRTFRERSRAASAVDVSLLQGSSLTAALDRAGGNRMFVLGYVPTVVLTAAAAVVIWFVPWEPVQDVGHFLASLAFPLAYGLALLALAGVGVLRTGAAGRLGGGFIAGLGLVLDLIYDVTSYLRVANPAIVAPRIRMIARYRAVLRRVSVGGYRRTIVMAHSQGTILTLATLLGDVHRSPAVPASPPEDLPADLIFLSYGSPVSQTYARRFPGQFGDWPARAGTRGSPFASWLNVYRAGDYIGRGIVPSTTFDPRTPDEPPIRERCLGPGHHTGYLLDERWKRIARHVVATEPPIALCDVDLDDLTVETLDDAVAGPDAGEVTAKRPAS